MTTGHNIDRPAVLADRLTACRPDVLRELLATFIHALMGRSRRSMLLEEAASARCSSPQT